MGEIFNDYSKYYDLLYQEKNYDLEVNYVHSLLKKFQPMAEKIIEFGSGTGKHAKLLVSHGYKLTGIEPSESMLKIANQISHPDIKFKQASLQNFTAEGNYDAALALFHVISYVNSNEELLIAFKKIHYQLKPGGVFIFDTWFTPAVLSQVPENRTKIIENDRFKIKRVASPVTHWNTNIVDVNYDITIQDKNNGQIDHLKETHLMRHFGIPEIKLIADFTGYKILSTEEFLSGKDPGPDTWGICFVLKKIK